MIVFIRREKLRYLKTENQRLREANEGLMERNCRLREALSQEMTTKKAKLQAETHQNEAEGHSSNQT